MTTRSASPDSFSKSVSDGPSRPWLVAVDTSTEQAGVALFDGERLLEQTWPGGRRQTVSILPVMESMLIHAGCSLGDVGAIAVASGPGSFTGLRVGLSLAKGLAIEGDRAVIGVPTLDVAAAPFRSLGVDCIAVIPAGRGRVVWSMFTGHGGATEPVNASFDDFFDSLSRFPSAILAGELTPDQRLRIETAGYFVATHANSLRRPGVLAEIGYRRWQQGTVDDPVTLEPIYVHGQPNPR